MEAILQKYDARALLGTRCKKLYDDRRGLARGHSNQYGLSTMLERLRPPTASEARVGFRRFFLLIARTSFWRATICTGQANFS